MTAQQNIPQSQSSAPANIVQERQIKWTDDVFWTLEGAIPTCIDTIMLVDGTRIGRYSRSTFDELVKEYPELQVSTKMEFRRRLFEAICAEPEEIAEKKYQEMLGCLPPLRMGAAEAVVFFVLSEFFTGNITSIYAHHEGRFWVFRAQHDISDAEIAEKVKAAAGRQAGG